MEGGAASLFGPESEDEEEDVQLRVSESEEDEVVRIRIDDALELEVGRARTAFGGSGADETGGVVWGAGLILARYAAREARSGRLATGDVLELGCGLGLPSLAAAVTRRQISGKVYASDASPVAIRRLARNAVRNAVTIEATVSDWTELAKLETRRYDAVMASDVVYSEVQATALAACVDASAKSLFVFACRDGRRGEQTFLDEIRRRGFAETSTVAFKLGPKDLADAAAPPDDTVQVDRLTEAPYTLRVFERSGGSSPSIRDQLQAKRQELQACKDQMAGLQADLRKLSLDFAADVRRLVAAVSAAGNDGAAVLDPPPPPPGGASSSPPTPTA